MNKVVILKHNDAIIKVKDLPNGLKKINVEMKLAKSYCPMKCCITNYNLELIKSILKAKGPSWLCDEVMRDEDPTSVQSDLKFALFSYVKPDEFRGKTILDFGCGCGSSITNIARLLPNTDIIGVEINKNSLDVAKMRKDFYKISNLTLFHSSSPDNLPIQINKVDFVLLSAVFEHLLPKERQSLILHLWECLSSKGILFINQTPDRRFPIETHTTGLPMLNYLPDKFAFFVAKRFSKRLNKSITWNELLKAGIRGTTPKELQKILSLSPFHGTVLRPNAVGITCQSDIWYFASRVRFSKKYKGLKGLIARELINIVINFKLPIAPYVSLAFKKS